MPMELPRFALFETPIGVCGIAWTTRGVTTLQLPESSVAATRRRLLRGCAGAVESVPDDNARRAIDGVVALLQGEPLDLRDIELDESGVPPFHRRVHAIARRIDPGTTLSYGEVAARLGEPGAARAVGQALGRNPFAIIVPCHRVLAADGRIGGFSAGGGAATKRKILAIEGARVGDAPDLFATADRSGAHEEPL